MMTEYLFHGKLPEDEKVSRGVVAQAPSFCVINDILYYVDSRHGDIRWVVVRQTLKSLVITENHCGPCAGVTSSITCWLKVN